MIPSRLLSFLCTVIALCSVSAAGEAVDINGDFAQVDERGQVRGWWLPSGAEVQRSPDGRRVLYLKAEGSPAFADQKVELDPSWRRARFQARMKTRNLQPGDEGWQNARFILRFEGADGRQSYATGPSLSSDSDWVTREVSFDVPEWATRLAIGPGVYSGQGELWVSDVTLEMTKAAPEPAATPSGEASTPAPDALPAHQRPRWGEEPIERLSATRGRVVLNGVWRFQPAGEATAQKPDRDAWGWIRVPGSWSGKAGLPGLIAPGRGAVWQDVDVPALSEAWYGREIEIPADWSGRAIELVFDRVSTDADVYVNGQRCGEVNWPRGSVRIDQAVTAGQVAQIDVRVRATAAGETVQVYMGPGQVHTKPVSVSTRGLISDVLLESRPKAAHISDVFLKPSTRRERIDVEVEVRDVPRAGRVDVVVEMLDDEGRVERRFTDTADVEAGDRQTLAIGWDWADPRLWDIDQPELYTAVVSLAGEGLIDDSYPQRFGFREFWIEGRRFFLNGEEIRLRPQKDFGGSWAGVGTSRDAIRQMVRSYREAGFNFIEMWPADVSERGSLDANRAWAEAADEAGVAIGLIALSQRPHLSGGDRHWRQPGVKEAYNGQLEAQMRPLRNHPSAVMWTYTANSYGHTEDQNPRLIGQSRQQEIWSRDFFTEGWHNRIAMGDEGVAMIKSHDPTRPVLIHQGGPVGDVYTLNNYLCWTPLQEREEWLSHWAQHGDMPYMAVEFGTPLHTSFMRGREGGGWGRWVGASHSEPLVTEYAAAYLGPQAYELEQGDYRSSIRRKYAPERGEELGHPEQMYETFWGDTNVYFAPAAVKVQELFIRNTWRSWRTLGVTGGMVPWDDGHGFDHSGPAGQRWVTFDPPEPGERGSWAERVRASFIHRFSEDGARVLPNGEALIANNSDTLAYIGGKPERVTSKDHHVAAGGALSKQVVLINDRRTPATATWTVTATVDGERIFHREGAAELAVSETRTIPFELGAPSVKTKTDGVLELVATIDGVEHRDTFAFRVYPTPAPAGRAIAVIDPQGDTAAMLEGLGFAVQRVTEPGGHDVLVVGRNAAADQPGLLAELERWVEQGGSLVVMAQSPEYFEQVIGFRTQPVIERRAFPVMADHPITAGIDAEDLRDWVGHSTLLDPKPDYLRDDVRRGTYAGGFPWNGWRWGGYGGVASAAIEKPHFTGWTPLIEGGFDLMYSPLMELAFGRGRVLLCTLDLEDHAEHDPAAALLARRIVEHAAEATPTDTEPTFYLGGDAWRQRLEETGLQFEHVASMPRRLGLLVIDPAVDLPADELRQYASSGGRVLVLATDDGRSPTAFTYEMREAFSGSLSVPDWPEARGLSVADLRYRVDVPTWIITDADERGADGLLARQRVDAGVIVAAQIDPWRLDTKSEPYLRYTRDRQARAFSQVLANLGGRFGADAYLFRTEGDRLTPISLAGAWQGRLTNRLPSSSDFAGAHDDSGVTRVARRAIEASPSDTAGWDRVTLPGNWSDWGGAWKDADGEAVFRRTFDVPRQWSGHDLMLTLGAVDDFDDTFINGEPVGRTDETTPNFYNHQRAYVVPARLIKPGRNTIVVRMFDRFGSGGFAGPVQRMAIEPIAEEPYRLYHPDYREDYAYGDDPYRYCRW